MIQAAIRCSQEQSQQLDEQTRLEDVADTRRHELMNSTVHTVRDSLHNSWGGMVRCAQHQAQKRCAYCNEKSNSQVVSSLDVTPPECVRQEQNTKTA